MVNGWPVGKRVRLRPPTVEDQPLLDAWSANRSRYTDFGTRGRTIAEKLAAGPLIGEHGGDLLVIRLSDDTPIGEFDWRPIHYGPRSDTRNRAWAVGREFTPEARGHGYGTETMRLMVDWLFHNTDANRIEGATDLTNIASQRSVERIGFRREGVLRGALYRQGDYHDLARYAILRADWQAGRPADRGLAGESSRS